MLELHAQESVILIGLLFILAGVCVGILIGIYLSWYDFHKHKEDDEQDSRRET